MTLEGTPNDETIRQAALDLLYKDAALDDEVFTPTGAIGLALPPSGEGPELAGDREPRKPKNPSSVGGIALIVP